MPGSRIYKQITPGAVYGRWTALMQIGATVHAICACGTKRDVRVYNLLNGSSFSCGCHHKEVMAQTRGSVRCDEDAKAAISRTQKERWKSGYYDPSQYAARAKELGDAHAGQPQTGGAAKGPQNTRAEYFAIRSPQGQVIAGYNLRHLVRENSAMFDESDLICNKNRHGSDLHCRATSGLHKLFLTGKNRRTSWKGWTKA